MVGKRKADDGVVLPNVQQAKKQRTIAARSIGIQDAGHKSNSPGNPPASVDVEKFVEARSFEINAMDNAMNAARAAVTHRVWQTLPRHLRRRAASHNVRRVPVRLRARAILELDGVKHKVLKPKSTSGKSKTISRTASLLKRQRNNTWLETHMWHARRMKMVKMWGYVLAQRPNEKSFRPSYRAAIRSCIIHDMSYLSLIELQGKQTLLKRILEMCCDPMGLGPGAARVSSGARRCDTHIYACGAYPLGLLGPVTILWQPGPDAGAKHPETKPANKKAKRQRATRAATSGDPPERPDLIRTVWIRSHPAMFEQVQDAVQTAVAKILAEINRQADSSTSAQPAETIEIRDLKGETNAFDLIGPKSTAILQGVLNLVKDHSINSREKIDTWKRIREMRSTGSLPRGMVLSLTVHDPRLSFPPLVKGPTKVSGATNMVFSLSPSLATSEIWSQSARDKVRVKKYKKAELDKRRSNQAMPGSRLRPQADDARIPVVLIQRTIGTLTESRSDMHGWTLLVPAGWAMPFFSSLVFTGARVGGLREHRVRQFECGSGMAYPEDYVATPAFHSHVEAKATKERARWERTPPAKRVSYDALEAAGYRVPNVWDPEWDNLPLPFGAPISVSHSTVNLIPTQPLPDIADGTGPAVGSGAKRPWLLHGANVSSIIDELSAISCDQAPDALFNEMTRLRCKRGLTEPLSVSPPKLWKSALITVNVNLVGRGSPQEFAIIYALSPDDTLSQPNLEGQDADTVHNPSPPKGAIIGYIISGNFSLSRGKGHGVGAVSLCGYVELLQQAKKDSVDPLALIRNRDETVCRLATLSPVQ